MIAAGTPSRSITLSQRLAPRLVELAIGRVLVLMIHAVEHRRDHRRDHRLRLAR